MVPSILGVLVFVAGITLMYVGIHNTTILPLKTKSQTDTVYTDLGKTPKSTADLGKTG